MAYRMPLAPPVLVGLAIDVSGSMRQSFDNQSGSSTSHISEFRVALDRSMDRVRAKILDASGEPDSDAPSSLVFVYAYGLSRDPGIIDLLAMLDDPRTFAALTLADTIREVV